MVRERGPLAEPHLFPRSRALLVTPCYRLGLPLAFEAQRANDWRTFLKLRARELHQPDDRSWYRAGLMRLAAWVMRCCMMPPTTASRPRVPALGLYSPHAAKAMPEISK